MHKPHYSRFFGGSSLMTAQEYRKNSDGTITCVETVETTLTKEQVENELAEYNATISAAELYNPAPLVADATSEKNKLQSLI